MAIYDNQKPAFDMTKVYDHSSSEPVSRSRFSNVIKQIELGHYAAAYEIIKNCTDADSNNIKAVLLMRMGKPEAAASLLRKHVWDIASFTLRKDVPPSIQLNLATAMFMSGNVNGCMDILRNVRDAIECEQAVELVAAVKEWEKSLPLFKWLDWKACGIEHGHGAIPFNGNPGRFGWESNGSTPKTESAIAAKLPPGSLGLAC